MVDHDLSHVLAGRQPDLEIALKYGAEAWILQQSGKSIGNQGRFDFGTNRTRQNLGLHWDVETPVTERYS